MTQSDLHFKKSGEEAGRPFRRPLTQSMVRLRGFYIGNEGE